MSREMLIGCVVEKIKKNILGYSGNLSYHMNKPIAFIKIDFFLSICVLCQFLWFVMRNPREQYTLFLLFSC